MANVDSTEYATDRRRVMSVIFETERMIGVMEEIEMESQSR